MKLREVGGRGALHIAAGLAVEQGLWRAKTAADVASPCSLSRDATTSTATKIPARKGMTENGPIP